MSDWQNRIVGTEQVAPEQLLANPANFRRHSREQQDAMAAVLEDVGWVSEVIVNTTTGHVLDGHMRVELAIREGAPTIPVRYVNLTPEEERKILTTFDPISGMAYVDKNALRDLLGEVPQEDERLLSLFGKLGREAAATPRDTSWLDRYTDDDQWDDAVAEPTGNGSEAKSPPPAGSKERPVEGKVHPEQEDVAQQAYVVVNFTLAASDRSDVQKAISSAKAEIGGGATAGDALALISRAYLKAD